MRQLPRDHQGRGGRFQLLRRPGRRRGDVRRLPRGVRRVGQAAHDAEQAGLEEAHPPAEARPVRDDRPVGPRDARQEVRLVPHRQPRGGEGRHARDVRGRTPAAAGHRGGDLQRRPTAPLAISPREEGRDPEEPRRQHHQAQARADRAGGRQRDRGPGRGDEAVLRPGRGGWARQKARDPLARLRPVRLLWLSPRPSGPPQLEAAERAASPAATAAR